MICYYSLLFLIGTKIILNIKAPYKDVTKILFDLYTFIQKYILATVFDKFKIYIFTTFIFRLFTQFKRVKRTYIFHVWWL